MSLGIQVDKEFLDLLPNTVLQLEENNPFLQLADQIDGNFSLPFTVPITDKNIRLLKFTSLVQKIKNDFSENAIVLDGTLPHSAGTLKLDQINGNFNFVKNGSISLFYLYGISDFFQLIKNKRLSDIDYGADIVFPWRGTNVYTGDGFFAHVTDVMNNGNPDDNDYSFFPVANDGEQTLSDDAAFSTPFFMLNNVGGGSSGFPFVIPPTFTYGHIEVNKFCPFPYLSFVMKNIFKSIGWTITGEFLQTDEFKKLVILHNKYIHWLGVQFGPNEVRWNMKNHVPNIEITKLMIGLQNRFGLWYDFDFSRKVCTVKYRLNAFGHRKDMTGFVNAKYLNKINAQTTIYSLKQSKSADPPDFSSVTFKGIVNNFFALPAGPPAIENDCYFVLSENAYYSFISPDGTLPPAWQKLSDNTFDFIQPNSTVDIPVNCLVPDSKLLDFRNSFDEDIGNLKAVFPTINRDAEEGETDDFYLAFHHGLVNTHNGTGETNYKYPFGSASIYNAAGTQLAGYALTFEFKNADGIDIGTYILFWKSFLNKLLQTETLTLTFYLDIVDVLNLKWEDQIIIQNVAYIIKTIRRNIPLVNGFDADCIRIS